MCAAGEPRHGENQVLLELHDLRHEMYREAAKSAGMGEATIHKPTVIPPLDGTGNGIRGDWFLVW